MSILSKYKFLKLFSVVLLAVIGGCKTTEKLYSTDDISIPGNYKGRSDSSSLAGIARDKFFTDKMLVALIDTALYHNADIQIALQRLEASKASLLMSKGALLPSLDINAYAGANRYGRYTIDGAGNAATPGIPGPVTPDYLAGISSSWEVDVWGKLRSRRKAAQMRYLSTGAGKNFVVTNLLAEVSYRYHTLMSLDEELEIISKNIRLQQTALEVVMLQKEGGRATELAVKQFAAQLAKTQSMEYQVRLDIATTENELNFLLGRYPTQVARSSMGANTDVLKTLSMGVPSALLANRPDVVQAELELKATRADVASARAAFLPSFNIMASVGYNSFNASMLFNPASLAYGFLGGLTAPVLNKNMIKASYDLALAEHRGAYHQYGKTVMNAVYEVINTLEGLESLKAQYELNEKEAKALNEAAMISNELYAAGYANYLEVITAQKNALEAELGVVRTRKRILFGNINLYRSLGGGWKS